MKTVEILKSNALAAYRNADAKGRKLLNDLLGNDLLSQNIMERVKTFEDVCIEAGRERSDYDLSRNASDEDKEVMYFRKLRLINRVFNEGWTPDYANSSELKYMPFFRFVPGSGFAFNGSGCDGTSTNVGARLVYKSSEISDYVGRTFQSEYSDFLTIK